MPTDYQLNDANEHPILSRMEKFRSDHYIVNQTFQQEADTNSRFEAGDQSVLDAFYGGAAWFRRKNMSFNHIRSTINVMDGNQRRTRKSMVAVPVENADAQTADQFTDCFMHILRTTNGLETISDAFRGALITGMNFLYVWPDFRPDPVNGNFMIDRLAPNEVIMDSYFRKLDLSDCNGFIKRSYVTPRECYSLLPHLGQEIGALNTQTYMDGQFYLMPESMNWQGGNLIAYDEFYYKDYRNQILMCDQETGEVQEWRGKDDDKLKLFLKAYPQIITIKQEVSTVKLAITLNGRLAYNGMQPSGIDLYPLIPVVSYFNPDSPYFQNRCQGVVSGLRDAQYLYNRRQLIQLDILESQITSGFIYKESALVNPSDIFMTGQGKGVALRDEASMADVQQIQSPAIPPTTLAIADALGKEMQTISGVSEELMGMASDAKAGITEVLRAGSSLTSLRVLYDRLDFAQKCLGKVLLAMIQTNWTPGKVQKILEGKRPTDQFYNKAFGVYDIDIQDGLNTDTSRQMRFAQLLQLVELGVPIPPDQLLEASTIQDKTEIVAAIKQQQQQQQQMQQQQMQIQMQVHEADIESKKALSTANRGLGVERISRVQENEALATERRAAAVKDQESGMLDLVKALKELEGMDLDHMTKLFELHQLHRTNQSLLTENQNQINSRFQS